MILRIGLLILVGTGFLSWLLICCTAACAFWYPLVLELHCFFIAIARAVVNEDGHSGIALHLTVQPTPPSATLSLQGHVVVLTYTISVQKSMAACDSHDPCRWTCGFLDPPLPVATRADEIFPSAVRHHVEELVGLEKDPQQGKHRASFRRCDHHRKPVRSKTSRTSRALKEGSDSGTFCFFRAAQTSPASWTHNETRVTIFGISATCTIQLD